MRGKRRGKRMRNCVNMYEKRVRHEWETHEMLWVIDSLMFWLCSTRFSSTVSCCFSRIFILFEKRKENIPKQKIDYIEKAGAQNKNPRQFHSGKAPRRHMWCFSNNRGCLRRFIGRPLEFVASSWNSWKEAEEVLEVGLLPWLGHNKPFFMSTLFSIWAQRK